MTGFGSSGALRLGIIGATGLVGMEMLHMLSLRRYKFSWGPQEGLWQPFLVASEQKSGHYIRLCGRRWRIHSMEEMLSFGVDIAFFSAGQRVAEQWAAQVVKAGGIVVDNSPAFRLQAQYPLVVPELLSAQQKIVHQGIIANPNCVAIQLAVALYPLHRRFGLREVFLSTYQSISGAGKETLLRYKREQRKKSDLFTRLHDNILFEIGGLDEKGDSGEEKKIRMELHRLLSLRGVRVHVTAARVPVLRGHAANVYVRLARPCKAKDIQAMWKASPGVVFCEKETPLAKVVAQNKVMVSRLRLWEEENGLSLCVMADNLRKGAAANALQIIERLWRTS